MGGGGWRGAGSEGSVSLLAATPPVSAVSPNEKRERREDGKLQQRRNDRSGRLKRRKVRQRR